MGSVPGLLPGANQGGWNVSVPFQAQQGGQASLGGNINPLLPINTSTNTSFPMMPQGAVSNSATSGFPALPTTTNTGGFTANTGGYPSSPLAPVTTAPGASSTGGLGKGGSATPGGLPGLNLGSLTPTQQDQFKKTLDKTYGQGMGELVFSFLQSGAGYNPQAINNLLAGLQPGFERQTQNLMQQFSAGGNRFGSGAQIAAGDLASQQQLQVGELETQMYEQAVSDYMNVLMGASGASTQRRNISMQQPSMFDKIASGIGAILHGGAIPTTNISSGGGGGSFGGDSSGGGGGGIGDYAGFGGPGLPGDMPIGFG